MNNTLIIRNATSEDKNALVRVARKSFYDTFARFPENSPEDLQSYLDKHLRYGAKGVVGKFRLNAAAMPLIYA